MSLVARSRLDWFKTRLIPMYKNSAPRHGVHGSYDWFQKRTSGRMVIGLGVWIGGMVV